MTPHPDAFEFTIESKLPPLAEQLTDPTHLQLMAISWNLGVLANEAKRIADALEQRDG